MYTRIERQMLKAIETFMPRFPRDTPGDVARDYGTRFMTPAVMGGAFALPDYTNRPSDYAACAYVRNMLAASGDIDTVDDLGRELQSIRAVPSPEGGHCTDVHFRFADGNLGVHTATVWYEQREDGSIYLYGEW